MNCPDIEWRTQALQECWDQKMTPKQFAEYLGVTRAQVYAIFAGRTWKRIPRPQGFVYPFPANPQEKEMLWREDCLQDYVRERMTPKQFAQHIGITVICARRILNGERWQSVVRPEGFKYPWTSRNRADTQNS
jgi:plasmid maintenance system antidote protein VapI